MPWEDKRMCLQTRECVCTGSGIGYVIMQWLMLLREVLNGAAASESGAGGAVLSHCSV